jgi:ribosomal protein S18 acetylase RimI-like enzyme
MDPAYGSRAWQTPADSRLMQALVSRCWVADWPAMHLHAGDVDWWSVHALGRTPGLEERIRLWYAGEPDDTELVGFGWYGPPGDADLVVEPDHRSVALLGPMVEWVDERAARYGATAPSRLGGLDGDATAGPAGAGPVRIWAVASATPMVDALNALGCVRGPDPGFVHFTATMASLDLDGPPVATGYTLSTIRTEADVAGRVAAGHAAFPGSTMTVEKYRFCRTTPLYRPALDIVARAPDGAIVAFALGWLDPLTLGVELEPVGVHPEHQRRGLGAAVSRAALRSARGMGATTVLIAAEAANPSANALYGSLGLRVQARVVPYLRLGRG